MSPRSWIVLPLVAGLALPSFGCGLFRRRASTTTNVSSSVEVNQQGRDVATLERSEYEVIDTSLGSNRAVSVYFLTLPVGTHTTADEQVDSAYYQAVDRIPDCDALMLPRVSTKRVVVPLLIVNIIVRKATVKGRCLHIKGDRSTLPNTTGGATDDTPDTAIADTPDPAPEPTPAAAPETDGVATPSEG